MRSGKKRSRAEVHLRPCPLRGAYAQLGRSRVGEAKSLDVDFNDMEERKVPGRHGGTGEMTAKMLVGEYGKNSFPAAFLPVD